VLARPLEARDEVGEEGGQLVRHDAPPRHDGRVGAADEHVRRPERVGAVA
jgi:hypothetical protein